MRATIAQRGTVRMALVPLVFVGWAAVAVATAAVITDALSTLVPLLVLVAGFEAVVAIHLNVERIGRFELHAKGELERLNPCLEARVRRMRGEMHFVQSANQIQLLSL